MIRTSLIFLFSIFLGGHSLSAQVLKGTLLADYTISNEQSQQKLLSKGREVDVIYFKKDKVRIRYGTRHNYLIDRENIRIDPIPDDFFNRVWYQELAPDFWNKNVTRARYRILLDKATQDFVKQLSDKHGFTEDLFVLDYLWRVMDKVLPHGLPKPVYTKLEIKILTCAQPFFFTSDQGLIILSTGMIALCRTEEELQMLLSRGIVQILLNYQSNKNRSHVNLGDREELVFNTNRLQILDFIKDNMHTLRHFADWEWLSKLQAQIVNQLPPNYAYSRPNNTLLSACDELLSRYTASLEMRHDLAYQDVLQRMIDYLVDSYQNLDFAPLGNFSSIDQALFLNQPSKDYQSRYERKFDWMMADILAENAWLEFGEKHYQYAHKLLDRVQKVKKLSAKELYLQALILRNSQTDEESSREALEILDIVKQMPMPFPAQLHKEAALLYLRLENYPLVLESLKSYKEALLSQAQAGGKSDEELLWAENQIYKFEHAAQVE